MGKCLAFFCFWKRVFFLTGFHLKILTKEIDQVDYVTFVEFYMTWSLNLISGSAISFTTGPRQHLERRHKTQLLELRARKQIKSGLKRTVKYV